MRAPLTITKIQNPFRCAFQKHEYMAGMIVMQRRHKAVFRFKRNFIHTRMIFQRVLNVDF